MTPTLPARSETTTALIAGAGCYAMWGFIPLVFQQMGHLGADAWEIMAHRVLWGVFWAGLLVLIARQAAQVRAILTRPRTLAWLLASTVLIAVNWTVYVIAVNSGRTLDASLGYYLNPLLNMAAGAWLFRERIDRFGQAAIALAAVGVILQALALGHPPWISLVLAFSFAAYGVIRKRVEADAQSGLFIECLLLAPLGMIWVAMIETNGTGHLFASPWATFWLLIAGPATVLPLMLFAWAARRMPLSTMGFLQFLAPTISFMIGVSQGEPFSALRAASFGFIWAGATVFAIGAWRRLKAAQVVAVESGLLDDPAEDRSVQRER